MGSRGASSSKETKKIGKGVANNWQDKDLSFRKQMMGRLESDVKYFLGAGNGAEKYLWAGNVDDQIKEMRSLYKTFTEKQRNGLKITANDINKYARQMRALQNKKKKK